MTVFVAPAYNEELNIAKLLDRVAAAASAQRLEWRLIVVDDGSTDRTAQIVAEKTRAGNLPVELVSYRPNRGAGEAFRRGLSRALEVAADGDAIVTLEADGTSDLSLLPAMLAKLSAGADAVIASCHARGGRMEDNPFHRVFLSRAANFLITTTFRMRGLTALSSFYRAYRPSALRRVRERFGDFSDESTFSSVVEVLVRLGRLRARIEEVPMVLRGRERAGKSKMKIVKNTLGYLRIIGRNLRA